MNQVIWIVRSVWERMKHCRKCRNKTAHLKERREEKNSRGQKNGARSKWSLLLRIFGRFISYLRQNKYISLVLSTAIVMFRCGFYTNNYQFIINLFDRDIKSLCFCEREEPSFRTTHHSTPPQHNNSRSQRARVQKFPFSFREREIDQCLAAKCRKIQYQKWLPQNTVDVLLDYNSGRFGVNVYEIDMTIHHRTNKRQARCKTTTSSSLQQSQSSRYISNWK